MYILLPSSVVALALLWAVWRMVRAASSRAAEAAFDLDWLEEFSTARYRPMERLFSEEDYEFLRAQTGFEPYLERRLRRQRRQIFRDYLRHLRRDFERLHRAARFLVVLSPEDQPDLAKELIRLKLVFLFAMATVEARMVLSHLNLRPVNVSALLSSTESTHACIRQLITPAFAQY